MEQNWGQKVHLGVVYLGYDWKPYRRRILCSVHNVDGAWKREPSVRELESEAKEIYSLLHNDSLAGQPQHPLVSSFMLR